MDRRPGSTRALHHIPASIPSGLTRVPPCSSWAAAQGKTATHAVVYARLIAGGTDYGVHAFMVQLRCVVPSFLWASSRSTSRADWPAARLDGGGGGGGRAGRWRTTRRCPASVSATSDPRYTVFDAERGAGIIRPRSLRPSHPTPLTTTPLTKTPLTDPAQSTPLTDPAHRPRALNPACSLDPAHSLFLQPGAFASTASTPRTMASCSSATSAFHGAPPKSLGAAPRF